MLKITLKEKFSCKSMKLVLMAYTILEENRLFNIFKKAVFFVCWIFFYENIYIQTQITDKMDWRLKGKKWVKYFFENYS